MAESAFGIIRTVLERYGLGTLAKWAWDRFKGGDSVEEIMLALRDTPEYKDRFRAMEQLRKEGRALSEQEYLDYEQGLRGLVHQFGLNPGLYTTRDYVAELLINNVTLVEAQSRMQIAAAASVTAPAEYKEAFGRLYGNRGDWTSIWLETDRTLPELEKQFAAASIAGEVTIANLGDVSRRTAEQLASAGITREQARQGLSRASRELGARLPGEAESGLGTDRLVSGALGVGTAAQDFERRVRQRIAAFAGGGSAATTQQGAVGAGTTRR